jgi:hypothetical protein
MSDNPLDVIKEGLKVVIEKALEPVKPVIDAIGTGIKVVLGSNSDVIDITDKVIRNPITGAFERNASLLKTIEKQSEGLIDFSGLINPFKDIISFAVSLITDKIGTGLLDAIKPLTVVSKLMNATEKPKDSEVNFENYISWFNDIFGIISGIKPFNIVMGKESWIDESKKGTYYDVMRFISFSVITAITGMGAVQSFFSTMYQQRTTEYFKYSKLGIQDYQRLEFRGFLNENELKDNGKFLGFDERALENVKEISRYFPTVRDTIDFAVKEGFEPSEKLFIHGGNSIPEPFKEYALKVGIDKFWYEKFWHSHWRLLGAGQLLEGFHRKIISKEHLLDYLRRLDYVEKDREIILEMSYNLLTRVDVRRVFSEGLISSKDLYDYYGTLGFSEKDQMLMTELAKRMRFVDISDIRKLHIQRYENGLINENSVKGLLASTGLDRDEILNYIDISELQKELDFKIALKERIQTKFYEGDIDFETLIKQLRQIGVSDKELRHIRDNAVLFDFRKTKLPTIAELKRYYKKGIIKLEKFVYYALRIGYEQEHIFWILQDISE